MTLMFADTRPLYSIDYASSKYLSIAQSTLGLTSAPTKVAVSVWFKPGAAGTNRYLVDSGKLIIDVSSTHQFTVLISFLNLLQMVDYRFSYGGDPPSDDPNTFIGSTNLNNSNWNHGLCHFDPTNATTSDRLKMWVNGSAETAFVSNMPNDTAMNAGGENVRISANADPAFYLNSKQYQTAIFVGSFPSITDVRDATTGAPKDVSQLPGLVSLLGCPYGNVVDDNIVSTDWTNNGGATASTDTPALF